VRLTGYINCAPDFIQQSQVMDGASNLLVELFGESGRHVRTVLGVSSLPLNLPLEIEMVAMLKN
jgi:enamine deaminase RidA (YjgF/YER057c/UK114 family)